MKDALPDTQDGVSMPSPSSSKRDISSSRSTVRIKHPLVVVWVHLRSSTPPTIHVDLHQTRPLLAKNFLEPRRDHVAITSPPSYLA